MAQVTNLNFSQDEADAIRENNFFILKDSATKKIVGLFGSIEEKLKLETELYNIDIKDINKFGGKIFRGENYRLFPYIILDCPRLFSTASVFAFRTMFWWGHEFSFTLHIQGEALNRYRQSIYENYNLLLDKNVFYCIHDTPWQYHFNDENYILLDVIKSRREELLTKPFIKLSRKIPVSNYSEVNDYCLETFRLFMGILK